MSSLPSRVSEQSCGQFSARSVLKSPAVSFHAFRHSHATMLITAGVDVLTISRRLGHAQASITLDVYGHRIDGADAAAAKAIEGVLK
jgi:integrase